MSPAPVALVHSFATHIFNVSTYKHCSHVDTINNGTACDVPWGKSICNVLDNLPDIANTLTCRQGVCVADIFKLAVASHGHNICSPGSLLKFMQDL